MSLPSIKRWGWRRYILPLAAASLAAVLGAVLGSGTTTSGATKYTVNAGGGRAGISVDIFRPSTIFVNQGDSVEFVNPYEEIHTVTYIKGATLGDDWFNLTKDLPFIEPAGPAPLPGVAPAPGPPKLALNPKVAFAVPASGVAKIDGSGYANSGVIGKGQSWTATFTKAGAYKLICVVHPYMEVDVQVLAPGVHVPTQDQLDVEAAGTLADQLSKGEASAASIKPGKTQNANGTTTWSVQNAPTVEAATVNRFIASRVQIGVGDTVKWENNTPVPHTVTFNSTSPEFLIPEPQSGGPPLLVVDPKALFPSGSSPNFDGSGYVNSGFLGTGPEATAGTSFSLTFTKPGTYTYICLLHGDQGMAGVIQVGPATGIQPPATGDAGLVDPGGAGFPYVVAGLAAALLIGTSSLVLVAAKRRA